MLRRLDTDVPGAGKPSPPQMSDDGTAAVVVVPFSGVGEDQLVAAVETLRERLSALEKDGLETYVTGGAGFAADVSDVFGGINGTLLIGAATIVLILLVLIYRSPVFWLIPFFTVLLTEGASRGTQYLLGEAGFSITGQAAGTASVLVFGAATDYALLLVARYREELGRHEDTHEAMRVALRGAAPAIVASAMTVVLALLTLLLARVGSSEALGPLAAAGVFLAMVFSLTLLPAMLLIAGRGAFWPRIPRAGAEAPDPLAGRWGRLGGARTTPPAAGVAGRHSGAARPRARAHAARPRARRGRAVRRRGRRGRGRGGAGPRGLRGGRRRTAAGRGPGRRPGRRGRRAVGGLDGVAGVGEPERGEPAPGSTSACPSIPTGLPPSRSCRRCGGRRARPTPAPWWAARWRRTTTRARPPSGTTWW